MLAKQYKVIELFLIFRLDTIDKFYDVHKNGIRSRDGRSFTSKQFQDFAADVIDNFGSQANYNGGRK